MSSADVKYFIEVFVTLFVIMDPPGTVPLFLSLTSGRSHAMRKRLAAQAVIVAFFVITVFALFGRQILDYLGITLSSMQIAGRSESWASSDRETKGSPRRCVISTRNWRPLPLSRNPSTSALSMFQPVGCSSVTETSAKPAPRASHTSATSVRMRRAQGSTKR